MDCSNCGEPVPPHVDRCHVCQADVGFPNLRAARQPAEKAALDKRFKEAIQAAKARQCKDILAHFRAAVGKSKAVIARDFGVILGVFDDDQLYGSFHQQITAGLRIPRANAIDPRRASVDATLFPFYHHRIVFAALSLDDSGLTNFGHYSMVLRDEAICNRASVFEENSFAFVQKHRIPSGGVIPAGHRAVWRERDRLAVAKLHTRLDAHTRQEDYADILLRRGVNAFEDDFIEVHICDAVHARAVEAIMGPTPEIPEDSVLWRRIERKLRRAGVRLEIG